MHLTHDIIERMGPQDISEWRICAPPLLPSVVEKSSH
jgi:hypothetical protein